MPQYLLLLTRSPGHFRDASPEAMQKMFERYSGWMTRMESAGRLVGGQALTEDGGRVIRVRNGDTAVTDGPYAEAKEIIGGYFVVRAKDYAEAAILAAMLPAAEYGAVVVRQIDFLGQPEPA